jgi:hypothetical protein
MRFVDGQGRAENDWLIFFFIYLLLLFVNYRGMLMQIDAFLIIIHRWSTCCIGSSPIPEAGFLTIFYYHLLKLRRFWFLIFRLHLLINRTKKKINQYYNQLT